MPSDLPNTPVQLAELSPAYFSMYAVSSQRMSRVMGFSFLGFLPVTFFYIALIAWTAAFIGLFLELLRRAGILQPSVLQRLRSE